MRHQLLLLIFCLTACGSPQKAFDNQDYDKAFRLALSELNKGKKEKELRTILRQSLERILEQQNPARLRLGNSEKPEHWQEALDINYGLQQKVKEARAFLPDAFEREAYTLPQQARWLRKQLYDHYFTQGQDYLVRNDSTGLKTYAQMAHGAFTKAKEYAEAAPPRLDSLTRAAFKKGIVYYQVETEAMFSSYRWEIGRIFDDIEDMSGGFIRIAYDERLANADCAIEIRFNDLEIDIGEDSGDEDYNKEVIVDYKTVRDTAGNETRTPVYGIVEGNVTIVTKTKTATWEADVRVQSWTPNCDLSSDSFTASASSEIREIRISGDERAIPERYLDAPEEEFTEEDDMAEELLEDLYEQIVRAYF